MIPRTIKDILLQDAQTMPVITITGPRQSGKTTLVKATFPDYRYLNLEDPALREMANIDPHGFIRNNQSGLIIDEIQYAPPLLSVIQVLVDDVPRPGRFVLTGSRNLALMNQLVQTLAGRNALHCLLPFSLKEIKISENYESYLFRGFYPRIYDQNLSPERWLSWYVSTYIERDVRLVQNIGDLARFQIFLRLCAGRTGQIINFSSLANDLGISYKTVQRWLSVLEATYILFRLPPYYKNFNKRLIKSPKIYFYDPGLASYLLGIRTPEQVITHYLKGELFETMIISEIKKQLMNAGQDIPIYYWRDSNGNEIDCIVEKDSQLYAIEIISGRTLNKMFFKGLNYWKKLSSSSNDKLILVYGGDESYTWGEIEIQSWKDFTLY